MKEMLLLLHYCLRGVERSHQYNRFVPTTACVDAVVLETTYGAS